MLHVLSVVGSEQVAQDVSRLPLYQSALEFHQTSGIPYRSALYLNSVFPFLKASSVIVAQHRINLSSILL